MFVELDRNTIHVFYFLLSNYTYINTYINNDNDEDEKKVVTADIDYSTNLKSNHSHDLLAGSTPSKIF